jgi:uncharacterized repeat protein (TIGR01451 family)
MKTNNSYAYPTRNASRTHLRSFLLVIFTLLAAYAVAGASSHAFANPGGTDGTVEVTADVSVVKPGDLVTYTIKLQNGSQAGLVTVDDNLPSHSTLVSAPDCTSNNGGRVSCTFAMFPFDVVSTQVTVVIDSDANCNSMLRNTAHVQGWNSSSVDVEALCYAP